jgi:hypothetical protein
MSLETCWEIGLLGILHPKCREFLRDGMGQRTDRIYVRGRSKNIPFKMATPMVPQPNTANTGRFDEVNDILQCNGKMVSLTGQHTMQKIASKLIF